MKVYILDGSINMRVIDDVRIIRIKSEKYNLLIMKDYWPIVGEIKGSCFIESDTTINFEGIEAVYSLSHNVFHLIIKEKDVNNA